MFRKTLIALLVLCAAVTAAHARSLEGVVGAGVAINADRKEGNFSIRAAKVTTDAGIRVDGALRFTSTDRATRTIVTIEVRIGRLEVNQNIAAFAGRGVMVVRRGTEARRFEGILEGRCADNHTPGEPVNLRDGIGFTFRPSNANLEPFHFRGLVYRGDIHVFSRSEG